MYFNFSALIATGVVVVVVVVAFAIFLYSNDFHFYPHIHFNFLTTYRKNENCAFFTVKGGYPDMGALVGSRVGARYGGYPDGGL